MTRDEIENISPELEMLARMWIDCDPNRMGGDGPDATYTLFIDGKGEEHPRWKWFIPRAQAAAAYFKAKGFTLTAAE